MRPRRLHCHHCKGETDHWWDPHMKEWICMICAEVFIEPVRK